MNSLNKTCLEERIRLVQEWKSSSLTQIDFAKLKGIEIGDLRNQIRYVRKKAPESLSNPAPGEIQFVSVPPELINVSNRMEQIPISTEHPVLTIQLNAANLYASNQIDLSLLKAAIEVVLSC